MTKAENTEQEIKRIEDGNLTYQEYIRVSRVGTTFRMSRTMRREVYNLYLDKVERNKPQPRPVISAYALACYDAICKHRDEVMLIDA